MNESNEGLAVAAFCLVGVLALMIVVGYVFLRAVVGV